MQAEELREQLGALQSEEEELRAVAVNGDAAAAAAAAEATERIAGLELELETVQRNLADAEEDASQMRREMEVNVAQYHEVRPDPMLNGSSPGSICA